jgi:bile acid:Na+ symporter, BASS family
MPYNSFTPKNTLARLARVSGWLSAHYLPIVLSSLVIGFVIGIWDTSPGQAIKSISSYLTFLMMLCISLTIPPRNFLLIARNPTSVLFGLGLNFLLLPALCWAAATCLVRDPQFSTGILLIGLVPSAINASVWTALLEGDTSISMAINACSMVLSSLLIPPIMALFNFSGMEIAIGKIIQQVALVLMVPLCLGLLMQACFEKYIRPFSRILPVVSAMVGIIFAFGTCNLNTPTLISQRRMIPPILLAALFIFPAMFMCSFLISKRFFKKDVAIAVTFAGSMKNLTVAMGVAFANFPPAVALPITIFSIPHMITSVLFYQYFKKSLHNLRKGNQHALTSSPADPSP